jgi:phosphatidylglycerophosphate synthase
VTLPTEPRILEKHLAFKAYEIEELADQYFFRPLGAVVAQVARRLGCSPTGLTLLGSAIGIAGGALLYDERLGIAAFALIILHSVIDSADGQLARMTGQVTEIGRVLDGVGGYMTHAAIYVAILAGSLQRGAQVSLVAWAALSAIANIAHAQLYDYHRNIYASVAIKGVLPAAAQNRRLPARWVRIVLAAYEKVQRRLVGTHADVEAAIAARSSEGHVSDADRARYRACFYWPVRGWNLLGDNTRFYAVGVLAWMHRLEWFFGFVLIPMNLALAALWLWQRRADRRFLGPTGV